MSRHLFLTLLVLPILFTAGCGVTRVPDAGSARKGEKIQTGEASWYGPNFHGNLTANGERYNMNKMTAAHRTLPFNTKLRVVNVDNGKSVVVRINDRGPYAKGRIIDVSKKAARKLDMIGSGTARVELYLVSAPEATVRKSGTSSGSYTLQIGSFSSRQNAETVAQKLDDTRIVSVEVKGGKVYRVYYGNYDSKKSAEKAKRKLKRKGFQSLVKQI